MSLHDGRRRERRRARLISTVVVVVVVVVVDVLAVDAAWRSLRCECVVLCSGG